MSSVTDPKGAGRLRTGCELFAIAVLFAAYAGQLPPDVNESHYLPKAAHFWNPQYCPDDVFLASEPSHWLFYATTGWWTLWLSLDQVAWLGRVITWLWLAGTWLYLARGVCRQLGFGLVTACWVLVLNDRGHLAGEWFLGGWEAKGIAYGFVFWAWGLLVRGQTRWLPPLLGLAGLWHLLIGGWGLLATCVRPDLRAPWLSWFIAISILALGALPPVIGLWHASPEMTQAAAEFQVRARLAHHLYFPAFAIERVAAFSVLLVAGLACAFLTRQELPLRRINQVALAAVVISWLGLLLCAVAQADTIGSEIAYNLLRFYWFRLADVAVATALALSSGYCLWQLRSHREPWRVQLSFAITLLIAIAAGLVIGDRYGNGRPRADQAAKLALPDNPKLAEIADSDWRATCRWIAEHTPSAASFLTPADQQTFKWYAGRTEICNWKDMPQDAASIAIWRERLELFYWPQREFDGGLLAYSDEQLLQFSRQFQIDYLVVKTSDLERSGTKLPVVYPGQLPLKSTFSVLRLSPATDSD